MSQSTLDFPELATDEAVVWNELRDRRGSNRAIRVGTLAELVGMKPRKVQEIVHALIHEWGKPIGTSMSKPFGYYHIVEAEERKHVVELHTRRGIAELATAAKISRISTEECLRRCLAELEGDDE